MISFDAELQQRLADLRGQGLLRELRRVDSPQGTRIQIGGQTLLNFSSNDYLGLANDPRAQGSRHQGRGKIRRRRRRVAADLRLARAPSRTGRGARRISKATEAALSFSSGYATAIGTICALLGKDDIVILDKLVHACIVDAARLCGAKIRVFAHNDLDDLEDKLKWADKVQGPRSKRPTCRAAPSWSTESIFSMDGDAAPLARNRRAQGKIRRVADGG